MKVLKLKVLDPDPQVACDMVSSIIDFYNIKVRGFIRKNSEKLWIITILIMARNNNTWIHWAKNRQKRLGTKYGILEYEAQTRK